MFLNNLLRQAMKAGSHKSWIEQLRPIIKDFKGSNNEALTHQEVERLSLIIRLKIDLEEGNITKKDLEDALNYGPTFH
ncbi:uncharacterized protein METZ01_LOCUS493700 [marine metagenome]|uniref:Uncharacterized protein n=1 Tax=marine metagenome TaxID=408172 RepID=A0A383D8I5_9ZZZZ|tara:strand:+ start:287 stop:520 length:234 start_codon:yes stop_codon:yes gene_type:complete